MELLVIKQIASLVMLILVIKHKLANSSNSKSPSLLEKVALSSLSFQVDVFCHGMHNVEGRVFLLNRGRF